MKKLLEMVILKYQSGDFLTFLAYFIYTLISVLDQVDSTWLGKYLHDHDLPEDAAAFLTTQKRSGNKEAHPDLKKHTKRLASAYHTSKLTLQEKYRPFLNFYFKFVGADVAALSDAEFNPPAQINS